MLTLTSETETFNFRQYTGPSLPTVRSKMSLAPPNMYHNIPERYWAQSFTLLKADLRQDINGGFAFSRCLDGTFP